MFTAASDGADGLGRRVEAARRRMMTVRLRLLVGATIAIVLAFIVANPAVRLAGSSAPYVALRFSALVLLLLFLAATWQPWFERRQNAWGVAMATAIAVLSARGGVLRGDIAVAATLHLILVLLNAAILPWGLLWQGLVVLVSVALMLVAVESIGVPPAGHPDVLVLINLGAGWLLSLFVAYQTHAAFDRGARENLRLAEAEQRNRALNEQLEAKVHSRTAELEDALADQRAVTRAISHDLRQPLRHIEGYARLLEDDLGAGLDGKAGEHLDRIRTSSARMGRMVDALLEFSRMTGRLVDRQRFDLSACALELCGDLVRREPARKVEFVVAPGIVADCDPALTRSLLRTLLDNAWKFTREEAAARIEFGRRDEAFFVRDNGTGFDMEHTRRLFHAFERLHHVEEFEGEGMGLAIAEKIVRSHGGRIWAESEPNDGATFLFTLRGHE